MRSLFVTLACLSLLLGTPVEAARKSKAKVVEEEAETSALSEENLAGLAMRSVGPALMAGRIADIAIHPEDPNTWYVLAGSGGIWKTTNSGTTWTPIFEGESSYSVGCITIDPNDPNVLWVGSGENVSGRHVGYGDGLYKSVDGGTTWEKKGLEQSEHIGMIQIDPRDSNTIYVAAQGPLWSKGGERGLYKTTDGGENWERLLGDDEYTGANEVHLDPRNPDVVYASTHQRFRNVAGLVNGGPGSGLWKSIDAGATWRELEGGLPEEDMGKIGFAISPQNPDVLYATIELAHREGGFFRSTDGGGSWEKRNDYISGGTGPHYYMELFASPHQFDRVYQMDVRLHVTEDGGSNFRSINRDSKHVDNHALAFNPHNPNYLLAGCDGGLYESWDLGETWKFVSNLPITQFYKVSVDYAEPFYNIVGGTQDNNSQIGPSRTDNVHGIRNSDWSITLFGDGHQSAFDPTEPNIVYSEWQEGNLVRHDRATGEIVYIQPQPEADEEWDRFNWDGPILISAHDPKRLYFASQRVWRSDDRGDSWEAISADLTTGTDRLTIPMMDRVQSFDAVWDLYAMSKYATITSLGESPLNENLLYVGTDDGRVQVSEDGGENWRSTESLPGVRDGFFVNDIRADLHEENTVYLAVDQHKAGDFAPYLYKSTDRGVTWKSLAAELPERHIVWRIVQDHVNPDLLFIGTEFGVFFSIDGGDGWTKLSGGAPNIPFRDLVIQRRENDLVGATFGRSFYVLDDYTPLRTISESMLESGSHLFPVRDAWWYVPRRVLGSGMKAAQGDAFFVAENPPFGATFSYYLAEGLQSKKDTRIEAEKETAEAGGDTPYPGWDAIGEEERELEPAAILTVRNSEGTVVRRVLGPAAKGFHRVAWDLRGPASTPWPPADSDDADDEATGWLLPHGTYSVSLSLRTHSEITEVPGSQSFEVKPMTEGTLPGADLKVVTAFYEEISELQRRLHATHATVDETSERLDAILHVLDRSSAGPELHRRAADLRDRVLVLHEKIEGNERRDFAGDPGPVSIGRRLGVAFLGNAWSTYGPTPTHRRSMEIAQNELAALQATLGEILTTELVQLESDLDAAGVPWTPGRGLGGSR